MCPHANVAFRWRVVEYNEWIVRVTSLSNGMDTKIGFQTSKVLTQQMKACSKLYIFDLLWNL